jgi:hypothetical protein
MTNSDGHQPLPLDELSCRTSLIVRPLDAVTINALFDRLEQYDPKERDETYHYLRLALDETRRSVGALLAFASEVSWKSM